MSRSYKKHPIIKYAGCKDLKKIYNRRLRRSNKIGLEDIPNGNAYKKMNESWNINDITDWCSWEECKQWNFVEDTPEGYRWWYKTFKGK